MKNRHTAMLTALALLIVCLITCLTACGSSPAGAGDEKGIYPKVTSGGVLDLPWGCTFEEFAAEHEGEDYEVYDQGVSSGSKFVFITKTIDGREIDYRLSFDSFEDVTVDSNNAIRLFKADFSPKNEEDRDAIIAAITVDMGEKITEHDTLNGNAYGIPNGLWISGVSVYDTLSEEQREKALKRGEEKDIWLITEDFFYTAYPVSVRDDGDTGYAFEADARWGVMLSCWLENY